MTLNFKTFRKGDKDFYLQGENGSKIPRAGFEFTSGANHELRELFIQAINNGWIKPVAHVKSSEYMWEQLGG